MNENAELCMVIKLTIQPQQGTTMGHWYPMDGSLHVVQNKRRLASESKECAKCWSFFRFILPHDSLIKSFINDPHHHTKRVVTLPCEVFCNLWIHDGQWPDFLAPRYIFGTANSGLGGRALRMLTSPSTTADNCLQRWRATSKTTLAAVKWMMGRKLTNIWQPVAMSRKPSISPVRMALHFASNSRTGVGKLTTDCYPSTLSLIVHVMLDLSK